MKKKSENLLLPAQFAKLIGISRQAISKKIQNDLIPTIKKNGKKYVDVNDINVKEYIRTVKDIKPKPSNNARSVKVEDKKIIKSKAVVKDIDEFDENTRFESILKRLDAGETLLYSEIVYLPKAWVDKIKIHEQTKQITQKRQQERKELINIKFINLLFGKIYDIDLNEFMAIKTRVKSQLAKIFKTNDDKKLLEAEKAIDEELWDTLRRIKYEFDKFLKKQDFKNDN